MGWCTDGETFYLRAFSFSLHCCSNFRILCLSPLSTLTDRMGFTRLFGLHPETDPCCLQITHTHHAPFFFLIHQTTSVIRPLWRKITRLFEFWTICDKNQKQLNDRTFVGSSSSSICFSLLALSSSRRRSFTFICWLSDFCAWRLCREEN